MFIVSANPLALGLLTPPGKFQSDIVVGDAQPLAFLQHTEARIAAFAATKKLMRKVPGRLVGQTEDENGKGALCLLYKPESSISDGKKRHQIYAQTKL